MSSHYCEKESEIVAATPLGQPNPELQTHARECPICSELFEIAASLREASVLSADEYGVLPSADFLWHAASQHARRMAVAKALRPIRFMTVFAILAFACLPLLGAASPLLRQWIAQWSGLLDVTSIRLSASFPALTGPAVLLGCSGMLVFLALSSWYVLRTE
jgi:hypothetical protein